MLKKKKISIPVIPYFFHVIIFDSAKEMKEHFKGARFENDPEESNAQVFNYKGLDYMAIINTKRINDSILVHECVHIKNNMFDWIGYVSKSPNDEMEAYFLQYIFEKVQKFYNSCK